MFTDWILIRRLAQELAEQAGGSRVTALGHLADGRVGLDLWRRAGAVRVAFDLFAPTPLVTLESEDLTLDAERGFIRTAGAPLRGLTLRGVRARRGDRLIAFDFAARSRFGVASGYSLVAELVPKFGNLILLKDGGIVSAYKEFESKGRPGRVITAGTPYEAPPLDLQSRAGEDRLAETLGARDPTPGARDSAVRALRDCRPALPQMVALSLVVGLANRSRLTPTEAAHLLLAEADQLLHQVDAATVSDELIVYRRMGELVQAHLVSLNQYAELERTTQSELLLLLAELRLDSAHSVRSNSGTQRRAALKKALEVREQKVQREITSLKQRLATVAERAELRAEGDSIFATIHELTDGERVAAKERAAAVFARYKKLGASIAPLRRRLVGFVEQRDALEQLRWELERAADDDIEDVARAAAALGGRQSRTVPDVRGRRKRKRLSFQTAGGSRILVGRSSVENAELTFEIARPNDLWFHAQKTPGAHVILQRDDKTPPPPADVELAASLAAYFSKAQQSPKVAVDYTLRKHVRKRPAAPAGLVFYTNPTSLLIAPRAPVEQRASVAGERFG